MLNLDATVNDAANLLGLGLGGEHQPRAHTLIHRPVAAGSGEDKRDRGQHLVLLEQGDDLWAAKNLALVMMGGARREPARFAPEGLGFMHGPIRAPVAALLEAFDVCLERAVDSDITRFEQGV